MVCLSRFFSLILLLALFGCTEVNVIHVAATKTVSSHGFSVSNTVTNEGSNLVFTVVLSSPLTEASSVNYSTINGTAASGVHYAATSGTLDFAAGETTKTVSVPTTSDPSEICAPNRTLTIQLSDASGSSIVTPSAVGTIVDTDLPTLSINDASGTEGGSVTFTASLSAACATKTVAFRWTTSGGTATAGADFSTLSPMASFPAGTTTLPIVVPTINDTTYEGSETFLVTLSSVSNAALLDATGTGTITDNDSIPVVNFSVTSQTVAEFLGTVSVSVSLSHPSTQTITVPFLLSGSATSGAGNDYSVTPSVTIAPGGTSTTFNVSVFDDAVSELSETAIITIDTPTNATKGTSDTFTLTISDNDIPRITNVTSPTANGTLTSGTVDISVVFSTSVDVVGTPLLNLNTTPARFASYLTGTGTNTLTFRYTISYDDASSDLDYASISALALSGGTIKDSVNTTNAVLTLPAPGASGSLGFNKNIVINAPIQPKVSGVTAPAVALYLKDDELLYKVGFTQNVTVVGSPQLNFNVGGTGAVATYLSGSGSSELTFRYVVPAGVSGITAVLTSPIALNGGSIKNASNIDSLLTFTPAGSGGHAVDGRTITLSFDLPERVHLESDGMAKEATITLSAAPVVDVTIPITTLGSAIKSTDYGVVESSVVIPAGSTSVKIHYDVYDDPSTRSRKNFSILADRPSTKSNIQLTELYGTKVTILDEDTIREKFVKIFAGTLSTCGITLSGVLKCWGPNQLGTLGDGTTNDAYLPKTIDGGVSYINVDIGYTYACGVTTLGKVKCWGQNHQGALGEASAQGTPSLVPKEADSSSSYKTVSVGTAHTCGITTLDKLKCWGNNSSGQIGLGFIGGPTVTPTVIDGAENYIHVSTGSYHSCGITSSGTLKCWGNNWTGQLGDGSFNESPSPVVVDSGTSYSTVIASIDHTCGITSAGTVKCWGYNDEGELGNGTNSASAAPVAIDTGTTYVSLSSKEYTTCGVTTGNVIKCWGANWDGHIGDGTTINRSVPVPIASTESYEQVATGAYYACALTASSDLKCWGSARSVKGIGPERTLTPLLVVHSQEFKSLVAAGGSCGITTNDDLFCWGPNWDFGLGDGTDIVRLTPLMIDPGTKYKAVSYAHSHNCGITLSNELRCWGYNDLGQVGDGTTVTRKTPVTIDPGVTYAFISVGSYHTCGITTAGVLKCWGKNSNSLLGDGSAIDRTSPTVIDSGTSYKIVRSGYQHTCGITTANVLKCWGDGTSVTLGDGSGAVQSLPVVIDPGTSYAQIAINDNHSCGVTIGGVAKCWGLNFSSALGTGDTTPHQTPVVADSGTSYKDIVTATYSTCGLTTGNALRCWGYNFNGQGGINGINPTTLDAGVSYRDITLSTNHGCGFTAANELKCWGSIDFFGTTFGDSFPSTSGDY